VGSVKIMGSYHEGSAPNTRKKALVDKLPVRFCDSCGCILEFRYTEYIPSINCSLLGHSCVNKYCTEFGRVFELSWSDTLILSRLGFALRKLGAKRIEQ
jgi:hypothetical protein